MNRYVPLALAGLFLVGLRPTLQAQDRQAEKDRAIAEIKRLGGTVHEDRNRPGTPVGGWT